MSDQSGKCPHCGRMILTPTGDQISIRVGENLAPGLRFSCENCGIVIGVSIDALWLAETLADKINEVSE